jgi:tRNA (guanine-N7-)-methyltransferase
VTPILENKMTDKPASTSHVADKPALDIIDPEQPVTYAKRIKSFVIRAGRMTAAQREGYTKHFGEMGLTLNNGMLDFNAIFGNDNPVVLEIGFGMGKSLVEMCQANPELNYIGIEVHTPGVGKILRDADDFNVKNLRVFKDDAIEVLAQCIPADSLESVQLYFPDPWHKARHHKRRIVQLGFVETLRCKIKTGGTYHMATDWENYAEHMMEVMNEAPGYENIVGKNEFHPRPDFRPLTKFEKRGENLGHGVWDLIFKKVN